MNKYKYLIEKFEEETELPATWVAGFLGGYTREYTEWLAETVVKNCSIPDVSDLLIAWEQYKKANWWESEAIDVEKHLMEKFTAIYKR